MKHAIEILEKFAQQYSSVGTLAAMEYDRVEARRCAELKKECLAAVEILKRPDTGPVANESR